MKKYILFMLILGWTAGSYAQSSTLPLNLENAMPALSDDSVEFDFSDIEDDEDDDNSNDPKIDTKRSLTENLKNNAPTDTNQESEASGSKNWVGQLVSTIQDEKNGNKNISPLASVMNAEDNLNKRSNASVFDISGVMLRMSYQQAEAALLRRGFKKTMQKLDIPNFIRWRNEDKCRNEGVIGYERLNGCVVKLARENKYEYVAHAQFNKYDTQETVHFYLTSTFTNNKVYKITYRTEAANNAGNSAKAMYLRNIKVYDFWKKINQKYGVPDNKEAVVWGLGNNKPYLKASTGFLVLEDPMLRELDYTRMSREDQRFMNTDLYTF